MTPLTNITWTGRTIRLCAVAALLVAGVTAADAHPRGRVALRGPRAGVAAAWVGPTAAGPRWWVAARGPVAGNHICHRRGFVGGFGVGGGFGAAVGFGVRPGFRSNPPGPRGGRGTNWANPPGPIGGPGTSPFRLRPYRDRDNNPPGPAGGRGTNWENRPGPRGGPGVDAAGERGHRQAWGLGPRDLSSSLTRGLGEATPAARRGRRCDARGRAA
jgi:hypothetical protein